MKKNSLFCLLLVLLISCTPVTKEVKENRAGVVSAKIEASEVGKKIMEAGGNAFDAMIATSFSLSVVYPVAGNITGGGFMVYRMEDGEVGMLDYRETAPAAATADMYLDDEGNVLKNKSVDGGLAVGVPGTVNGLFEVYNKFASLPLWKLMEPAIELAEKGYALSEKDAKRLNKFRPKFKEINGDNTFYNKDYKKGDVIKNPALGKVLRTIMGKHSSGFYKGWIADAMVKTIQENGGIITNEDLLSYKSVWREPFEFDYKELKLYTVAPPSSGGVVLGQIMKMIENQPLSEWGVNSAKAIHLITEAERRAYADRSKYLGDPDYVNVPIDQLMDETYLSDRMASYSPEKATPSSEISPGTVTIIEKEETTHFSIVDVFGNAVSVTTTLNGAFGSKLFVNELGVFLNNEMDDFSIKPGFPNIYGLVGSEANAIAPGKRMLSSMTPTIITKDNKLYMVVGTPGGSTIITSVLQTILNTYEFGMSMQEAVSNPRFHHQWLPDMIVFEPEQFDIALIDSLKGKGHTIEEKRSRILGKVDAILVNENGTITTGADPRGDDAAAVY